jgi:hypothetical protein
LNLISVSTLLYVADDDVADPDAASGLDHDTKALKIEAKILEGHNQTLPSKIATAWFPL